DAVTACPEPRRAIIFHSPPASRPLSLRRRALPILRKHFLAQRAPVYAANPALRCRRQTLCHIGTTSTVPLILPPARPRARPPPLLDPERSFLPSRSPLSVCPSAATPTPAPLSPPGQDPIPAHAGRHGWCSGRGR
ncbi:hypothetical protein B0H13DRAFT_2664334, partial [Mycena leptocephala]